MSNQRVRLTHRKAADMSTPYPGNVNQPDRTDPAWDQYHTFEQTINHELPDMRHEWQDDQRDDIGFGIPEDVKNPGAAPIGKAGGARPSIAASHVAANKAVKLAVLLLGEKVPEDVIEQQARDFLGMNRESMDRTLSRFASTQKFYADDADGDDDVKDDADAGKEASVKKADSAELAEKGSAVPPAIQTPANPQEADKTAKSKKAEAAPAAPVAPVVPAAPAPAESDKTASDDDDADTKSPADMDIELQSSMDEEPTEDAEADAKLARVFEGDVPPSDDEDEPVVAKAKTAKKAGITRLGGQPKVASEEGDPSKDLSQLWASAPDVKDVFR